MHAEAGLQLPVFSQGFLQEVAGGGYLGPYSHLPLSDDESLLNFHVGIADGGLNLGNMVQTPTVAEYDMGGEGDLFKAPEAILEEPALELHIAAAMSILSTGGDAITEPMKVADMESIHLDSVIYGCKKNLLEESEIEDSITELLGVIHEVPSLEKLGSTEGSIQKSISSGSLNSVELIRSSTMRPDQFFDLQGLDLAAAYSLRRAYSEGDIQSLGNKSTSTGNTVAVCSSFEQLLIISDLKTEQRQQKLSRYREKKSKRNFGRKIKYACRKALADSQPRVRGRFAKSEECESSLKANMRMLVLHSLDGGHKLSVHTNYQG
ncbi:uncharacterized protein LOC122005392 [Zingiber officinale]|uniref:CCT domain-containing protein n=1 Tax=Zingiber officinale TaxID=94328 RepID=A0A8J5FQV4_ZINOF|nr:uncharacterized protein LOC122005392 [Zingiber officinale]KAG6489035.1 hypothetical protein ZIOFF_050293 [Zingiber officinale]